MARYTEEQLRHKLKAAGYALLESQAPHDLGNYLIVDADTNAAVPCPYVNMRLDDVEGWARSMEILES